MSLKTADILATVQFDPDGYMINAHAWTPEIAEAIAASEEITLTDRHWAVINFARQEYEANGEAPTLRQISKKTDVGTKELYALFPDGPGKQAAKIAGLRKPTGCI